MSGSNEKILRSFLALWSTRDSRAMAEHFAENGVYDNVPDKRPMVGRDTIRQWLEMCFEHLTRIDVEVLNLAATVSGLFASVSTTTSQASVTCLYP